MDMSNSFLFNDGWKFELLPVGTGYEKANSIAFSNNVEIPHDWLIYDTKNLYKSGEGWYKKTYTIDDKGEYIYSIDFDGVYMDSTVYVNGKEAGTWRNGYASFSFDVTDLLENGENIIMVQVRYTSPNSRWYSGAGIYRNVYLIKKKSTHIKNNGVYISADGENGHIIVKTEIEGNYDCIFHTVYDMHGYAVATSDIENFSIKTFKPWTLEKPYLYTLKTEVLYKSRVKNTVKNTFGFRTIRFDSNNGFFLNDVNMKLKGVCLHHDLGCLGVAVNYRATERQIMLMKDMGVNAIRTSHNMPSRELIEICDKAGMLVVSESFDMWELPKNEFDNARFFKDTAHDDVMSWVKRDRNHPCIIMWSIGNEIYDTHALEHGYEIALMLADYVKEADPNENAVVTIGSNFIEWENAQKIGEMLVHSGYNYTEKCYDEHHEKYPNTVIYGSETSSAVRSRGIYHFPADLPLLSHDDNQCSSLENSYVGWGRTAEDAWLQDRNRKFCAGQFIWTGIDYIGEPTPYSTKNSYFGAVDTAGIPKDVYYFYQSVWTDADKNPMIHLLPYWDFNNGQIIDVIAYTNAPKAELFVNGVSHGIQEIDHANGEKLHASWKVPYKKGNITVNAMNESGEIIATDIQKSFDDPARVCAKADRTTIKADGMDLCFVEISTVDSEGTFVANARNRVSVEVSGAGGLLGLDNGDSTDFEQYKTSNRKLFSGKLIAVIGSNGQEGDITIKVTSEKLELTELTVKAKDCTEIESNTTVKFVSFTEPANGVPVRKIEVICNGEPVLNDNRTSLVVDCELFPKNATYHDGGCKVVKLNSTETNIAEAEYQDGKIIVNAKGDGDCILRIYAYNGSEYPQVISDVAIKITGLGDAVCNPYKMVNGSNYTISSMPINIIENNALGGFTEQCWAGYNSLDFGKIGTDKCRLYIGNSCNKDIPIEIWDGTPDDENSKLIMNAMFPHNNGWGNFEPYDYQLPYKLKGMHTICFVISDKCIFGGFEFITQEKAYAQMSPVDNDFIYGDDFKINNSCVENIGNNVVIQFTDMDFADGTTKLEICGKTPNEVNTIQLRYTENGSNKTQLLEFAHSDEYIIREFLIEKICEQNDISFVFMPGSNFDFKHFRFIK